jgi:hypothetical protein
VTADLDAARGLRQAAIVGASAPVQVHAGQVVRVRLSLHVYRGGMRRVSFPLRIPAGARGPVVVSIRGPMAAASAAPGSPGLSGALATALGGPGGGPPMPGTGPVSSLAALRAAIAGIGSYDGLYANLPGHVARRVYRDRGLLITGRTLLPFVVAG